MIKPDSIKTEEELTTESLLTQRTTLKNAIDTAAGNARSRYVSQGDFIQEEYRIAYEDVKEWRLDETVIPDTLQVWADAAGLTVEEAAVDIETTALQFDGLLKAVRTLRLQGKAAVESATEGLEVVAQPYLDQLEAL